ncbi:MAG: carbonic anhydrase [Acidobacteriaceae bacterium]
MQPAAGPLRMSRLHSQRFSPARIRESSRTAFRSGSRRSVHRARVAGNCAHGTLTESLYYGTKDQYLGAFILFVLGHSDCGAVKAAIASHQSDDPDDTFEFAKYIYPAVEAAINLGGNPDDLKTFVPLVTEQNVILGVQVLRKDPELQGLQISGGVYNLATSRVNILEIPRG